MFGLGLRVERLRSSASGLAFRASMAFSYLKFAKSEGLDPSSSYRIPNSTVDSGFKVGVRGSPTPRYLGVSCCFNSSSCGPTAYQHEPL